MVLTRAGCQRSCFRGCEGDTPIASQPKADTDDAASGWTFAHFEDGAGNATEGLSPTPPNLPENMAPEPLFSIGVSG